MQIPYRKPTKFSHMKQDPLITQEKFDELQKKLDGQKARQPAAMAEVARLAEMGDFSENAAYQMAKGRLRGINQRILELESQLNHSEIITQNKNNNRVQVGHTVTVFDGFGEKTFHILGSSESNPAKGIISHSSPIGAALIGREVGDVAKVILGNKKEVKYKIVKIV